MNYSERKELLKGFRNRQLSAAQQEIFYKLVKEGAYKNDFARMLEEIENGLSYEPQVNVDQHSLLNIKSKLILQIAENSKRKRSLIRNIAVAASILLVLGAGWGFYTYQQYSQTQHFITVNVPQGKMYELKLEDGTVIKLLSGSSLKYPEKFEKHQRRVHLMQGKAFFEVAHDSKRPFTVKSGELSTTALGTSFTVQYNKNYQWEKVNLYTGKVVIEHDPNGDHRTSGPTFLTPGQAYEIKGREERNSSVTKFETATNPMANGALLFASTPFEEAIYQISSYYQVRIRFNAAELKKHKVNGEFQNQSAQEVLHTLTQMYHLNLVRNNDSTYAIINKTAN
ncbi:hypothetical protein GCM10023149_15530 [Mucilaginibacter gynuensis]|uniref:FecR family protein n=1 Tax=Mucilaginibacter gynuensis TaxID=1302236 RepID=A0ABP8G671_9SPHI